MRHPPLPKHLERGGSFPTVGLESVSLFIDHCRRGGVLDVDRLRTVAVTVDILAGLRRRLEHHEEVLPQVSAFADDLCDLKQLASELNATFDPSGMISDNASPELRQNLM